jgi:hypothetical protein
MGMGHGRVVAFVLTASVLAACSSTAKGPGRSSEPGEAASEFAGGAPGASPGASASAGSNSSSGGATSGAPGRTSTDRSAGGGPVAPGKLARGTGSVEIGIHNSENGGAAARFGANALPPSGRKEVEGVVRYMNAHGGLGGKKIIPVFHTSDPLAGNFDALDEAACREFTEDHHVLAAVSDALTPSVSLPACMAKHKTPLIWTLEFLLDDATAKGFAPYLWQPHTLHWTRLGAYVDRLVATKFLTKTSKIGLLRYGSKIHTAYSKSVIKPRLAAHGLKLTEETAVNQPQSAAGAGPLAAELSNISLRWRASGIDRVIFVPSGAVLPYLFIPTAQAQGFHPRYGLSSLDPPDFVTQNVPKQELRGAVAVAWLADVDTREPARQNLPNATRCDDAVAGGGGGPRSSGELVIDYCESLFLLKDALDRNPVFTVAGLRDGILGLARSWKSPRTFGTRFKPGWPDGAAAVRMMRFDEATGSFKYSSGLTAVP